MRVKAAMMEIQTRSGAIRWNSQRVHMPSGVVVKMKRFAAGLRTARTWAREGFACAELPYPFLRMTCITASAALSQTSCLLFALAHSEL